MAFNVTKYSRQLQIIQKDQKPLKELYRNLRSNQHVEWPIDDVLKAFTDKYCEVRYFPSVDLILICSVESTDIIFSGFTLLSRKYVVIVSSNPNINATKPQSCLDIIN